MHIIQRSVIDLVSVCGQGRGKEVAVAAERRKSRLFDRRGSRAVDDEVEDGAAGRAAGSS